MSSSHRPPNHVSPQAPRVPGAGPARAPGARLPDPSLYQHAPVASRPLTFNTWIEGDFVPSWLRPFTLDPNTRFTRTPDHLLRPPSAAEVVKARAAEASPSEAPAPAPRKARQASEAESKGFVSEYRWAYGPLEEVDAPEAGATAPAPAPVVEDDEAYEVVLVPERAGLAFADEDDFAPLSRPLPETSGRAPAAPAPAPESLPSAAPSAGHGGAAVADAAAPGEDGSPSEDVSAPAGAAPAPAVHPHLDARELRALAESFEVACLASDLDAEPEEPFVPAVMMTAPTDTGLAGLPASMGPLARLIQVGALAMPLPAPEQDLDPPASEDAMPRASEDTMPRASEDTTFEPVAQAASEPAPVEVLDTAPRLPSAEPEEAEAALMAAPPEPADAWEEVEEDHDTFDVFDAEDEDDDTDEAEAEAILLEAGETWEEPTDTEADETPASPLMAEASVQPDAAPVAEETLAQAIEIDEPPSADAGRTEADEAAPLLATGFAVTLSASFAWSGFAPQAAGIPTVEAEAVDEAAPAPALAAPLASDAPAPSADAVPALVPDFATDGYQLPDLALLQEPPVLEPAFELSEEFLDQNSVTLQQTLRDFGVRGEVIDANPGPVVTLYEFEPAPGTKSSRVIGLSADIARSMSAVSARVAVIEGRNVIGIELPNQRRETVWLRELLASHAFGEARAKLAIALGKTIGGEPVIADLARMPHLLVAGTTGSGKSVAINTMILSLLYRHPPEACRLIMIDPKMLELSIYEGIPHLLTPVVTDPKKAIIALKWAVKEMEDRYRKMARLKVRNIDGFNARVAEARAAGETITTQVQTGFDRETGEAIYEEEDLDLSPLPYIVIIVDEMADLMMVAGKEIEGAIQRLAQMARAAGIHLVMATQRPSVDVITGTIKANFPTRISFQVTSKIDSRTILGEMGAETLLGQGDMLYMASGGRIVRVHGPFVSDGEVEKVVAHLKTQGHPEYLDVVTSEDDEEAGDADDGAVFDKSALAEEGGDHYEQAVALVMRDRKASTSYIQRRLQIGYNKAASLMERMETEGIVGPANHAGKREILVDRRS